MQQIANYKYSEFKLKQEVNMKTRKVATTLLAIATLMSTFIFPSFAKNNHDVEFSYSLPNEGYYQVYGVGQRKEDASGSYVYSYSSNPAGGTYYSIHGGHTTSLSNGYVNCTKNDSAVIYAGQKDVSASMCMNGDMLMHLLDLHPLLDNPVEPLTGNGAQIHSAITLTPIKSFL